MPISLVLDIIISALLILTIAYAVRLNQRLSQLRSDKNELLQLAKTFADATTRAEVGIQNLKVSSEALRAEVSKAESLKDDLAYLVDRGGRAADEMAANVRPSDRGLDRGVDRTPERAPERAPERVLERAPERTSGRTQAAASSAPRRSGADARLIEDAIRVASSHQMEPQKTGTPTPTREDRTAMTRRIAGGALATRGLGRPDTGRPEAGRAEPTRGGDRDIRSDRARMHDDEAIEDTQAARELLKALGAVK